MANQTKKVVRHTKYGINISVRISVNEPIQNVDNILEDIEDATLAFFDNKAGAPVSSFIRAEIMNHEKEILSKSRYGVCIQEGLMAV